MGLLSPNSPGQGLAHLQVKVNNMLRRSKTLALRLRQEEEIIPNLPDDIARNCLLRVPYKWHSQLKLVCRKWRNTVSEAKFYEDRMTTGKGEQLICMIKLFGNPYRVSSGIVVLDPVTRTWEMLRQNPDFPRGIIPLSCACVCVNGKLVVIGGYHPEISKSLTAVYIFDFASAKWRRGTDMPTKRHGFACSVSSTTGVIYVAGGMYRETMLFTAEAYNVEEDRWQILPPMSQQGGVCHGVFLANKFFVFRNREMNAEIFDTKTGLWRGVDNMWSFQRSELPCIVASGHLYASTETELMKYNPEENDWVVQSVLPTQFRGITCTAEWHGHIFVSKRSTVFRRQDCYLLNPSTNELISVPERFPWVTVSAATVEI